MKNFSIDNFQFNENSPIFIIAEVSANHWWKIENVIELIKTAADFWADAVKLQTYTADTMTLNSDKPDFIISWWTAWDWQTLYNLYKEAYMPWEWYPKLKEVAKKEGIILFSTPFDETSVDFLEKMDVPCYKIASFENTDIALIKKVAETWKPIIISNWMATFKEIETAVNTIKKTWNNKIIALKCTSAYPASYDSINLNTINDLKEKLGVFVWLSDHTLSDEVAIASVVMWVKVIEKHFCLDRNIKTADSHFSLEPKEFGKLITSVRNVEKALWKTMYWVQGKSEKTQSKFRRSLWITKDVKKWDILTKDNISAKRPGNWLSPIELENVLWKKVNKDLTFWTPLTKEVLL